MTPAPEKADPGDELTQHPRLIGALRTDGGADGEKTVGAEHDEGRGADPHRFAAKLLPSPTRVPHTRQTRMFSQPRGAMSHHCIVIISTSARDACYPVALCPRFSSRWRKARARRS